MDINRILSSPPRFLLPAHVIPAHVLPSHRLWPLPRDEGFQPYDPPPIEVNGRLYQNFRRGVYPFPCDEAERHRLELFHKIFLLARNWALHARPLPKLVGGERVRILDVGTGTGVWAIRMAQRYPGADVLGLDIVDIQPRRIPRNLRFQVPFDFGTYWHLGEEMPWDLIHLRCALGSVSSWTSLYQNIFQRLRPDGILEQVEIDLQPRWDDGRHFPPNHPLQQWYETLLDATTRAGRPIGFRHDIVQLLRSQGFVDVRTEIIRLPITERPANYGLKRHTLSRWYTAALIQSLEALSLGPFTQNLGWTAADVREFVAGFQRTLGEMRDLHLHNNMHVVTARRSRRG